MEANQETKALYKEATQRALRGEDAKSAYSKFYANAIKEQKGKFKSHRVYYRTKFSEFSPDMDFIYQFWALGFVPHGGAEIGECLYVANRIDRNDPALWTKEWQSMAERVEEVGKECLERGHHVSAREAFLRASNYYRITLFSISPVNPEYAVNTAKMRACFGKAAELGDPCIEPVSIPFEDMALPGYFLKPDDGIQRRKTLLMIGGGETYAQDLYFWIAPAAVKRGYNFITVDLPGQGSLPDEGHFHRADSEAPMEAILDYLVNREDVDASKIGAYGISGGGYFVPRAACYEKRIRAVVANSLLSDNGEIFETAGGSKVALALVKHVLPRMMKKYPFDFQTPKNLVWRYGLDTTSDDPLEMFKIGEATRDFVLDPALIECPMLILIGEGEAVNEIIQKQATQAMDVLPNPRKATLVAATDLGGATHCVGGNVSLMSQLVLDWLDEVFAD